jgi:hypothetical protein
LAVEVDRLVDRRQAKPPAHGAGIHAAREGRKAEHAELVDVAHRSVDEGAPQAEARGRGR